MILKTLSAVIVFFLASSQVFGDESVAGYHYTLAGEMLQVIAPNDTIFPIALPCRGKLLFVNGDQLYVGCQNLEGIAIFSLKYPFSPKLIEIRSVPAEILGFHVSGDQVWVEVVRTEALPLNERPIEHLKQPVAVKEIPDKSDTIPPESTPSEKTVETQISPSAQGEVGHVVELRDSGVVIDLGQTQGILPKTSVALFLERETVLGAGESGNKEEDLLAVGVVSSVSEHRALVSLGLNEKAPLDALVRPTSLKPTENVYAPPRAGGLWEMTFHVRPFLALGYLGFGNLSDLSIGRRLESNWHFQLILEPFGFGVADVADLFTAAGNFLASYDTRFFEVGFGIGGASRHSAFSIAQIGRIGAQDGLHLIVRNTFMLFDDDAFDQKDDQQFHYGGTVGEVMSPIGKRRTWLFVRGGGGRAGFGFGELGIRHLVRGNGLKNSLFLSVTIGGGVIEGEITQTYIPEEGEPNTYQEHIEYGGPLVGFGLEWRF